MKATITAAKRLAQLERADQLSRLEAWLSEEGIDTRFVEHVEFDSNWSQPFRVVLKEWIGRKGETYTGEGPNQIRGLAIALDAALEKARGRE